MNLKGIFVLLLPCRPEEWNECTYQMNSCIHWRNFSLEGLGGATSHIDEAIVLDRETLELRLSRRYNRLGAMTDLGEATVLEQEALPFTHKDTLIGSSLCATFQPSSPPGTSDLGQRRTWTRTRPRST